MPSKVYSTYLSEVNENLYDPVVGISVNQIFKESALYTNLRSSYIATCSDLISEVEMLSKLIKEFIE